MLRLQSKWILQILLRILSQNQSYEAAIAAMKAFLPSKVHLKEAVLSIDLALALDTLHELVHTTQTDMNVTLPEVLEKATQTLTAKSLQSYHKPITRVASMTHFKRLLNDGHKIVVNSKLDQEADVKATVVQENLDKVRGLASTLDAQEGQALDFGTVISVLQD